MTNTPIAARFVRAVSVDRSSLRVFHMSAGNVRSAVVDYDELPDAACYAARISSREGFRTLALDLDANKFGPDRAAEDAEKLQRLLGAAFIACVRTVSGPSGGQHVLATVNDGLLPASLVRGLGQRLKHAGFETIDLSPLNNATHAAIRPPLSPHRGGIGRSQPLESVETALEILETGNSLQSFRLLLSALPKPTKQQPLRTKAPSAGRGEIQGRSGSERAQSVITSLVNRGSATPSTATAALRAAAVSDVLIHDNLAKHAARGDLVKYVTRSLDNAVAFVAKHPPQRSAAVYEDREVIDGWRDHLGALHHHDVPPGVRRMSVALLLQAERRGRRLIGLSVRQAGEWSGQSSSTAHRALDQMVGTHMLEIAADERGSHGKRYRMEPPERWDSCTGGTVGPHLLGGVGLQTVPLTHELMRAALHVEADAWSDVGLGEPLRLVYYALACNEVRTGGAASPTMLAEQLGVSAGTARRHLKKLGEYGLARNLGRSNWSPELRSLDEVALQCGSLGEGLKRQRAHRDDRFDDLLRRVSLHTSMTLTSPLVAEVETFLTRQAQHVDVQTASA